MNVWRAVRGVAGGAAFDLYCFMLENKWAALIGVAGKAHRVLRRRRPDLIRFHRAMRVVAVIAFHQALVHSMMEGHRELRFLLCVAGITEFRFCLHQQEFRIFAVVRRMAIQAAHVVLDVHRAVEIHLFFSGSVTSHAAFADRFRAGGLETENLLHVARIVGVRRARPVATFAALMRGATAFVQRGLEVR